MTPQIGCVYRTQVKRLTIHPIQIQKECLETCKWVGLDLITGKLVRFAKRSNKRTWQKLDSWEFQIPYWLRDRFLYQLYPGVPHVMRGAESRKKTDAYSS